MIDSYPYISKGTPRKGALNGKRKRKNARVKLPIRQAHELMATLVNVREFCGMYGASDELMEHIRSCQRNVDRAVADRNRAVGVTA